MKICLWLENSWAFGRIAASIQKYSRHQISIVPWRVPLDDFTNFDLLYTPCWFAKQIYLKHGGKTPMVTGVHGIAELFNYDPQTLKPCRTSDYQVERGQISDNLRRIFKQQKIVGCVSREIINLLRPQVNCKLLYTPCGVDTEFFRHAQYMPLTVLCPVEEKNINTSGHGYDVKRWGLVREIQKQLPDVQFKFLPRRLTLAEMPDWYRGGNVLLCLSHSEGGPLGVLEAGAGGVVPLSTPVGVMPEVIIPGHNGELFNSVEVATRILSLWKRNDDKPYFAELQGHIQETMISRSWRNVIGMWDTFFEMQYEVC